MINQIHIASYRLDELPGLLNELPSKNWEYLPTNELRIASYLNNPRAQPSDEILFIAESEGQLIAFRIVLPEILFYENKEIRFAWNSGSWTHPNWRRKGVSSKLLKSVYAAWEGRLAFSNVSPESKKLLTQNDTYLFLKSLNGAKFHLRSDLAGKFETRFPKGKFLWNLWRPIDLLHNLFTTKSKKIEGLEFEPINQLTDDSIPFFEALFKEKNGFFRATEELNWIVKYPWITENIKFENTQKKYPFTLLVQQTCLKMFWIRKEEKTIGFVMLFLKNKQVTIPYLYLLESDSNILSVISNFIFNRSVELGGEVLLIANQDLAIAYKKTGLFKYQWSRKQEYYISKDLAKNLDLSVAFEIFDGDGDNVFSNT